MLKWTRASPQSITHSHSNRVNMQGYARVCTDTSSNRAHCTFMYSGYLFTGTSTCRPSALACFMGSASSAGSSYTYATQPCSRSLSGTSIYWRRSCNCGRHAMPRPPHRRPWKVVGRPGQEGLCSSVWLTVIDIAAQRNTTSSGQLTNAKWLACTMFESALHREENSYLCSSLCADTTPVPNV